MSSTYVNGENTGKRVNKRVRMVVDGKTTSKHMFACIYICSAHFYPPLHHNVKASMIHWHMADCCTVYWRYCSSA